MASDPSERENHESDVATERKVDKVRRYKVLFHNDDYTTMEFVVLVLMKFFHKSETEATHITAGTASRACTRRTSPRPRWRSCRTTRRSTGCPFGSPRSPNDHESQP